jgi:hypothetical protein
MSYTVTCPACDEELEIAVEASELTEDEGCIADCPRCNEKDIEFDYDPATDTLTATPGQYTDEDGGACDLCGLPLDECDCDEEMMEDEDDAGT